MDIYPCSYAIADTVLVSCYKLKLSLRSNTTPWRGTRDWNWSSVCSWTTNWIKWRINSKPKTPYFRGGGELLVSTTQEAQSWSWRGSKKKTLSLPGNEPVTLLNQRIITPYFTGKPPFQALNTRPLTQISVFMWLLHELGSVKFCWMFDI
jgi:hypothetical protein